MKSSISVAFVTLGCAKNEVDSEKMRALIVARGMTLTDDLNQADCIVINTCAFITEASEEAIATILETADLPRVLTGQCRLVVTGCLPSRYGDDLKHEFQEVAAFVPVGEESTIAEKIWGLFEAEEPALPDDAEQASSPLRIAETANSVWAYLKIAEGCSRRCSYCTIPDIRGPYVSYPLADLLAEAAELVNGGVRELVLIAQDTGLWRDGEKSLPDLLEELARLYPDVWLRIMYLQPTGVSERLLEVMKAHANICDYLDIPLQHASGQVLANMNRSSEGAEHLALLERIRGKLPDVTLRTTLIAGFPAETRAQARQTELFVQAARFDYTGVFVYSAEEGTPAAAMDGQVAMRTRRARAQRLRDMADAIGYQRAAEHIGIITEVLIVGYEDGVPVGRSRAQAPEADGIIYLDGGRPGQRVRAEVYDSFCYDWYARIVESEEPEAGADAVVRRGASG